MRQEKTADLDGANLDGMYELTIRWTIEDVKTLNPDLTDQQAEAVLKRTLRHHDAAVGINWDILQVHIDEVLKCPTK